MELGLPDYDVQSVPVIYGFHCVSFVDYAVEERPSQISVMQQLEDGGPDPLVFVLNANLLSMVKIVNCKCLLFNKS